MIVLKTDKAISRDHWERIQQMWRRSVDAGELFVLRPGWSLERIDAPAMAGPLVDYQAQLGDA